MTRGGDERAGPLRLLRCTAPERTVLGGLGLLEVDKGNAAALPVGALHDLAGENVAEAGKGVVQGAVVDVGVQARDEDVADARAALGGVALRPHDPQLPPLERLKVQVVQRGLGCWVGGGVEGMR